MKKNGMYACFLNASAHCRPPLPIEVKEPSVPLPPRRRPKSAGHARRLGPATDTCERVAVENTPHPCQGEKYAQRGILLGRATPPPCIKSKSPSIAVDIGLSCNTPDDPIPSPPFPSLEEVEKEEVPSPETPGAEDAAREDQKATNMPEAAESGGHLSAPQHDHKRMSREKRRSETLDRLLGKEEEAAPHWARGSGSGGFAGVRANLVRSCTTPLSPRGTVEEPGGIPEISVTREKARSLPHVQPLVQHAHSAPVSSKRPQLSPRLSVQDDNASPQRSSLTAEPGSVAQSPRASVARSSQRDRGEASRPTSVKHSDQAENHPRRSIAFEDEDAGTAAKHTAHGHDAHERANLGDLQACLTDSNRATEAQEQQGRATPKRKSVNRKSTAEFSTVKQRDWNSILSKRIKAMERRMLEDTKTGPSKHTTQRKESVTTKHGDPDEENTGASDHAIGKLHAHLQEATATTNDSEHEVELVFSIVRWSSQGKDGPATNLAKNFGKWETAPLHVHNEYVVLEFAQPCCVTGVQLSLCANDMSPRQCRMQYSRVSANGPWREAWRFDVKSVHDATWKSVHDYAAGTEEFKTFLAALCQGNIESAWKKYLDLNGDGNLSYVEFMNAFSRLRTHPSMLKALDARKRNGWGDDLQALFEQLDIDGSGQVSLNELRQAGSRKPSALWWRLEVVNNWGSSRRIALQAPLKLLGTEPKEKGNFSELRECRENAQHHHQELTQDLSKAFDMDSLDLSPETRMLRRVKNELQMDIRIVEDIYDIFRHVDTNSNGSIDRHEFDALMTRLHGSTDVGELPEARLNFFWQQADRSCDGRVCFEEFIKWFSAYFAGDDLEVGARLTRRLGCINNFYANIGALPRRLNSIVAHGGPKKENLEAGQALTGQRNSMSSRQGSFHRQSSLRLAAKAGESLAPSG
eukprot:gnl/TRDRNA2_/TRDRNA2_85474_c0_seq2.p1 gnl/TRDRNA2_/TRDRNA2_85474_c0~~gnl/TRDRNA2_/TRDRNA2_85474_c0_seq2.p1  ORF type:complete len:920 (+),score=130.05 gnl/TRDRNA2_/TRDRNA2_85474_c0_seq2:177-2936(+)